MELTNFNSLLTSAFALLTCLIFEFTSKLLNGQKKNFLSTKADNKGSFYGGIIAIA